MQQGDVLLQQTNDGGEIDFFNNLVVFSPGLETSVYISLFGGNERDDGSQNSLKEWWGNSLDENPSYKIRSATAFLLQSIPAVPVNLRKIEEAVKSDLKWMLDEKVASSIEVNLKIPALNKILMDIAIIAEGVEQSFSYVETWKNSA